MRKRRLLWWSATAVGAVSTLLVGLRPIVVDGGPVLCLFRRVVELPCPGCGLTRAFEHLAGGDVMAALAFHPLAPLLASEMLIGWGLLGLAAHGVGIDVRRLRIDRWLAGTGYLLLAVWMGRLAIGDLAALG